MTLTDTQKAQIIELINPKDESRCEELIENGGCEMSGEFEQQDVFEKGDYLLIEYVYEGRVSNVYYPPMPDGAGECGQELRYNITITKITWYEPNEWEDIAYLVNKADIKEINKHLANLDYENIRLI